MNKVLQSTALIMVAALVSAVSGLTWFNAPRATERPHCGEVGTWLDPASGDVMLLGQTLAAMARRSVVLLGEVHDNAEHHRWQLHTLAALHAHKPNMVIGFEMFPRRVQAALDAWVAGKHDVDSFLEATDWEEVWGFDKGLYLPLFHFARQHRIPMVALNVERRLIAEVGRQGWAAIPAHEREGVSDPAPASRRYREELARVVLAKRLLESLRNKDRASPVTELHGADAAIDSAADLESVMKSDDFKHFVEAQLTWDRAMAEALATARHNHPDALVVGIIGRGHLEHGFGVPHQLTDLGVTDPAVLLPEEPEAACQSLRQDLADGIFVVAPVDEIEPVGNGPTLGVFLEATEGGVRVTKVVPGSVAETNKLTTGDIVTVAAGVPVERVSELIAIVQRQAPGTWLPLTVKRGNGEVDLVAKFPAEFAPGE